MGRYLGPKHKLSRRYAENIGGYAKTPLARKPYPPGQHGPGGKRRKKQSTFGRGLTEKQKLKAIFNLRERQLRIVFDKATRMAGNTGDNLIQLLECRLDNMVYRMGFALTSRCARQLVAHGHVLVDGQKVDIASYLVRPGQEISIREKSRNHPQIQEAMQTFQDLVSYVKREDKEFKGTLMTMPQRKDIPVHLEERLVVELLAK